MLTVYITAFRVVSSATGNQMAKAISYAKHRLIKRHLRLALDDVARVRRSALFACRQDPEGSSPWDGRGQAIANYLGARRWVSHYRALLATSEPVKMANAHAYKVLK